MDKLMERRKEISAGEKEEIANNHHKIKEL